MKRSVLCVTALICLLLPVLAGCKPAHETYENFTVYFADRETNTLSYIKLS